MEDKFADIDLFDCGVDGIGVTESGMVRIIFDLFHCDDPERDVEGVVYALSAEFRQRDVMVLDGALQPPWSIIGGEVLKVKRVTTGLILGICWRRAGCLETFWTEIKLTAPPVSAEEVRHQNE